MGLFGRSNNKIFIQDPLFGRLEYRTTKNAQTSYFYGKHYFAPTGSGTEILIYGVLPGPTDDQRAFYTKLETDFDTYIPKLKRMLEDEFRIWQPDFLIKDFKQEFKLDYIIIPSPETKPLRWELTFTTTHDQNHNFTVDFIDDEPQGVSIDG
jgi:hypothetical protein